MPEGLGLAPLLPAARPLCLTAASPFCLTACPSGTSRAGRAPRYMGGISAQPHGTFPEPVTSFVTRDGHLVRCDA